MRQLSMQKSDKDGTMMGYDIFSSSLKDITIKNGCKQIINTINAYSYVLAKRDENFKNALRKSDILLPDGFPIVVAEKLLGQKKIQKIAGEDIFFHLMGEANKKKQRIFFLGSSESTLIKIKEKVNHQYPNVNVESYSPPYKQVFDVEDNTVMLKQISDFNTDILFVGMTAPKQEKWVLVNENLINTKVICCIGAVFDFYAETIKRPSSFWIKMHLEWLVRFVNEPKRLFSRYFLHSPIFFVDLFKHIYKRYVYGTE